MGAVMQGTRVEMRCAQEKSELGRPGICMDCSMHACPRHALGSADYLMWQLIY